MQLIRHTKGFVQPCVSSSRPDWNNGTERLPSDKSFSDCMLMLTPDAFMSLCNQRLCHRAMKETRDVVENIVRDMYKSGDSFFYALALMCVPNCVAQCGCPELKSCGFIDMYKKAFFEVYQSKSADALFNIEERCNFYTNIYLN